MKTMMMLGLAAWTLLVSSAHLWLNVDWDELVNARRPVDQRRLMLGYIPVT